MRKILYILFASIFFISSCKDKLELEPFDATDANSAFDTNSEFDQALKGAYRSLLDANYYGGEFFLLPDVISDNLIISSEGRTSYSGYYLFLQNGELAWLGFFSAAYTTILRTNYIIENIDNLSDGDFKDNILGQALAIRAMAHFDLGRVYSVPPQYATASDLGMAYVSSTNAGLKPGRMPVADYFAMILDDYNTALGLIGPDNGVGFLNEASVHGLLSRYQLYVGNNAGAIASADNAIAAGNGAVASITDFPLIWTDETENGVAFKLINTDLDRISLGVVYNQASPDGVRDEYVPDFAFYQQFAANDVRSTWFQTGPFAGKSFNHVIKYLQRPGSNQAVVDAKVLRWSEVYLTKAEAHAKLNQDAQALAALDAVRSQRRTGFISGNETGNALDDAIALERRLELAFESDRFFYLKSNDLPIERSAFGDLADGTGTPVPADARSLPTSSNLWEMPIPQTELNSNENMQPNPSNN